MGDSDSGKDDQSSLKKRRYRNEDYNHRRDRRRRKRDDSSSSNSSSVSSNESVNNRRKRHKSHRSSDKKKSKKHRKKKDRKHRSKKKNNRHDYDRSQSRSHSPNSPSQVASSPLSTPPGAHELATALTQLFKSYPTMSYLDEGGVPLLFIQLSRGTEYNLSQMPDRNLAHLLEGVFKSLSIHGMELGVNGAWKWSNALTGQQQQQSGNINDLALLRLTRALLNGVGVTMDNVEAYEQDQLQDKHKNLTTEQESKSDTEVSDYTSQGNTNDIKDPQHESEEDIRRKKRVERMTSQMLDRFDPRDSSSSDISLATELQGICNALIEGESIQLDGIENAKLKATLAQLFNLIGLEMVEMNDDDEVDEGRDVKNDNNTEKILGYALPDVSNSVTSNLHEVLRVCRYRSSGGSESAPTSWMATNPSIPMNNNKVHEDSSSEDDDGPAPLGTMAAVKAAKRKRETQIQNINKQSGHVEGEREEWMMIPGEHDFLKGISKSTRSRTFKNEKMRGQAIVSYAESKSTTEQINPKVLDEVNAIQRAYEQSRGPSLLDAHRQKTLESKIQQQQQRGNEFTWSRDKNLEDGRRVDKNALHQVMGGAKTELKSKFQGSLGGL